MARLKLPSLLPDNEILMRNLPFEMEIRGGRWKFEPSLRHVPGAIRTSWQDVRFDWNVCNLAWHDQGTRPKPGESFIETGKAIETAMKMYQENEDWADLTLEEFLHRMFDEDTGDV